MEQSDKSFSADSVEVLVAELGHLMIAFFNNVSGFFAGVKRALDTRVLRVCLDFLLHEALFAVLVADGGGLFHFY